jgi:predicted kinase
MRAVIFDIDGTLANCDHRLHYLDNGRNWDGFFGDMHLDTPIEAVAWLAQFIASNARAGAFDTDMKGIMRDDHVAVLVVTARPDDKDYRAVTEKWLADHDIVYDKIYMRAGGDYRPDQIVKGEILQQILEDGYDPFLVVDDRPQVVDMWRSFGITTFQCAADESKRCRPEDQGKLLLTMLVGPACAGKSTYCKKHFKADDIISTDDIRVQLYGDRSKGHNPDELARTWKYAHSLIKARLENGVYTVLDATNLKKKDRLKVLESVPSGVLVEYVVLDRDYDTKIAERGVRSVELIDKHHKTFKSQIKEILNADGMGFVMVKDAREKK